MAIVFYTLGLNLNSLRSVILEINFTGGSQSWPVLSNNIFFKTILLNCDLIISVWNICKISLAKSVFAEELDQFVLILENILA